MHGHVGDAVYSTFMHSDAAHAMMGVHGRDDMGWCGALGQITPMIGPCTVPYLGLHRSCWFK